jgi:hypothetical protein
MGITKGQSHERPRIGDASEGVLRISIGSSSTTRGKKGAAKNGGGGARALWKKKSERTQQESVSITSKRIDLVKRWIYLVLSSSFFSYFVNRGAVASVGKKKQEEEMRPDSRAVARRAEADRRRSASWV